MKEKLKNKKRKKQIVIIIVFILIVIAITVVVIWKLKLKSNKSETEKKEIPPITIMEDGTKVNTREKINEAKLVNGLLITNIQLTERDGLTTLLANVTNKGEKKTDFKRLKIVFLDENGNEISTATVFITPLEVGETTELNASATANYINAYDFRIEEN